MPFDAKLIVGCPAQLPAAIDVAAKAKLMKSNEWIRRALVDRLEADGIKLTQQVSCDA
jgi:hypothetical protein